MQTLTASPSTSADELIQRVDRRRRLAFVASLWVGVVIGFFALFSPHAGFSYAAALFTVGAVTIALRPLMGVYLITFFGLLADNVSAPWWPFLKNGSSGESWLFVHGALIFSPMEAYLVLTCVAVVTHVTMRRLELWRPPLVGPLCSFMFFLAVGLVWGIGRGGNINIALWEIRPFLALFLMYFLATTLLETRRQLHILSWVIASALFIESVRIIIWSLTTADADLYDSLVEHSGASHMNVLFFMAIFAWIIRGATFRSRLLLVAMSVPVLWVYMVSERRSAIAGLIIGGIIVFMYLAAVDARRFWQVGPMIVTFVVLYVGAFWSASGPLGFPAGVIKTILIPGTESAADQASNSYRIIEHLDILATIHRTPLLGVGFGQQYDRPIPLPDISQGFIWWEYITHNAILWIWLKAGVFGFIAMFNFLGRSLYLGMRTAIRAVDPADRVIAATAMIFIPVYMIYSYVDISWANQSMILLGVSLAVIARIHDRLPEEAT